MNLTYSLENTSTNNCIIYFYSHPENRKGKNKIKIGFIRFHIEYSQIIISLVFIYEEHRNKGFGSQVLNTFDKYILQKYKLVNEIVLIPEYFNGIEKNRLCLFYEKNGFIQESKGLPTYIKNIRNCM